MRASISTPAASHGPQLTSLALAAGLAWACPGCGDEAASPGEPLGPAAELAIVAHQGDELWFMQPDLTAAVQGGGGTTVVYVTAGDREDGATPTARRDGARAALAAIAGAQASAWSCGAIQIADHTAEHCRLAAAGLSLVFLDYPVGGKDGSAPASLLALWEAKVRSVPAVGRAGTLYDQAGLIATLAEIIDSAAPTTLRTLEIAATHGDDHSDHMLTGALALLATAASSRAPAVIAYRGDSIAGEPANLPTDVADRSTGVVARFAACTAGCGACGEACPADRLADALPDAQLAWLARRYPVAMRRSADGLLRFADGCVAATASGANASIIDCASAPAWHLADDGTLGTDASLCLDAILTGEIVAGPCSSASPGNRYFLDEDGHLWSGVVPAPQADMAYAHLDCVLSSGGRPRAALCGQPRAPTVEIVALPAARAAP